MKLSIILFLIICISCVLRTCKGYYNYDLFRRMRYKILIMDKELTMDAIMKRATINHLKIYYDWRASFQVAEYVHQIRLKYTRLTYIYLRCNQFQNTFKFNELLNFLREAQHLAAYIDNLINMLEEWEDRNTRKKRITRSGGNPIQSSSHQIDSRKVLKLHPQKIAKQSDSILSQRQKQKDYMERKKILWSLAHGSSRVNLKKDAFKTKNKVEEGFQSDLDNH